MTDSNDTGTKESHRLNPRKTIIFSLFLVFLKIGAFTWGGGYVMLPLIRNEVIQKRKWLTLEEFIDGIAIAQSSPGAIAVNAATFVGNKLAGKKGAVAAVLGAVLPSYISIVVVAIFFLQFQQITVVRNFFKGAIPAVLALIVAAIIDFGRQALKKYLDVIISLCLLFLLLYFRIHPILIVVIAGMLGLFVKEQL